MRKGASFSECGKYRYTLWRVWDEEKPTVMCIGLNPSTANAEKDDPTIRILIDTLKYQGYGALTMVNLYALISPHPKALFECADPQNGNIERIMEERAGHAEVIFCWGDFKGIEWHAKQMINRFPLAKCFGVTKNGSPLHPMALMYAGKTVDERSLYNFTLARENRIGV